MANNQSVRRNLDAFTRGQLLGSWTKGRSVTSHSETGGRQREKSLDTRHRRLDDCDIAFYRGQKTALWWSVCTTPCTVCTFNACPSEKAFYVVPEHRNWRDNEWDEYSLQMKADSV
ncbi:hypothetical protein TNCV_2371861 [Trichonephila clavipes]|nr:hypothetical protein TNCV_2371861 [Trichonephila clavipes]